MGVPNTQRKYKDKLFVSLFKKKEELLALYNAVNGSNYKDPEELIVNTIEDVIYLGMKNDVSFIFDARMNLYEHQSTWNPNMPLRGLFYFAMLYKGYVVSNGMDIYSERRLELPTPQYVVFYNGTGNEPDKQVLRLSDSFRMEQDEVALECLATVVNINLGKNRELMEQCSTLYGYSYLIAEIRSNIACGMSITEAIDRAVKTCIKNGILAEYLREHRAEVCDMIMTEYNEELHNRTLREDGRAVGRAEGRAEGEDNLSILYRALEKANRLDDFGRSMYDKDFLEELKKEFREQMIWDLEYSSERGVK